MKILIINYHPCDVMGGSEIQCGLIATHLSRLGHEVIYFAVEGKQQEYPVPYCVEPGSLTWKELRHVVAKHHPDVVFWRFSKRKFFWSAVALKTLRAKIVFSVCNVYDVTPWAHKVRFHSKTVKEIWQSFRFMGAQLLSSRVNHVGFHLVDGVIAQTEEQTRKVPVRKETVIYNSVDDTVTPFSWKRPFILWVANIKPRKNPEEYIELARKFQEREIDFLMVGHIQSAKYAYLAENPHISPNFHYIGPKTYQEVNGIIRQSLFLIHTTYGPEGFPNVFIQAWSQGKPTISLYCDPDHLIRRNKLGFLSENVDQLVKDTQELIDNIPLREEMGRQARIFAEQHCKPETNIPKFAAFFHDVCYGER